MNRQRLCHKCLVADAEQHEEYARTYGDNGNFTGATRETAQAEEYRNLIARSINKPCSFHTPKSPQRREIPVPTRRPPGILEGAGS